MNNTEQSATLLGYSGEVAITVMNGKRKVKTYAYHNNGYKGIFKFLAFCLAGNYTEATNYRPIKVALYANSDTTCSEESYKSATPLSIFSGTDTSVITHDESTSDATGLFDGKGYTAVFHFTVPYTKILNTSGEIRQIMLFNSKATSTAVSGDTDTLCAVFSLINSEKPTEWNGIDLSDFKENYNLVVEWALNIANKTTSIN